MPARFSSSYSLWPEQAQPRERRSIALVSGGFVAGLVIAMAGNWMLLDTSRPTVGSGCGHRDIRHFPRRRLGRAASLRPETRALWY